MATDPAQATRLRPAGAGQTDSTSGAIIGRYWRGEITHHMEMAKKVADTFGTMLNFVMNDKELSTIPKDQGILKYWREIDVLEPALSASASLSMVGTVWCTKPKPAKPIE